MLYTTCCKTKNSLNRFDFHWTLLISSDFLNHCKKYPCDPARNSTFGAKWVDAFNWSRKSRFACQGTEKARRGRRVRTQLREWVKRWFPHFETTARSTTRAHGESPLCALLDRTSCKKRSQSFSYPGQGSAWQWKRHKNDVILVTTKWFRFHVLTITCHDNHWQQSSIVILIPCSTLGTILSPFLRPFLTFRKISRCLLKKASKVTIINERAKLWGGTIQPSSQSQLL